MLGRLEAAFREVSKVEEACQDEDDEEEEAGESVAQAEGSCAPRSSDEDASIEDAHDCKG